MDPKILFQRLMAKKEDPRLALFVISSHVDKPVLESFAASKYEIKIQAGAAKTNQRVCELNDHDDFAESISNRNHRYSEFTSLYWMYKNANTDYIGISHYRRKYMISDEELSKCMDEEIDIITLEPICRDANVSVKDQFVLDHYGDEWRIAMELLKEQYPQYYETAETVFKKPEFHPYAMSIMKKEWFHEYCEMMYSILFETEPLCCEKKDVYQRRDMGFIAERFLSMFVEYKKKQGCSVKEVGVKVLKTDEWIPWEVCDLSSEQSVMEELARLFSVHDIEKCIVLLRYKKCQSAVLGELIFIFNLYMEERKYLQATFLEYLPTEITDDIWKLIQCFSQFETICKNLFSDFSEEYESQLVEFLRMYSFTDYVIYFICAKNQLATEGFLNNLVLVLAENDIIQPVLPLLERMLKKNPDGQQTLLNIAYILVQFGALEEAELYLGKIANQDDEIVCELKNYINNQKR